MPVAMSQYRAAGAAILVFAIITWVTLPPSGTLFTVRPVDPGTGRAVLDTDRGANFATDSQKFSTATFSPEQFVSDRWHKRVLPWMQEHAVDIDKLFQGLQAEREATVEQYGVSPGETSGYSFAVRGEGSVQSVDTSTPVGKVKVSVRNGGASGVPESVTLLVGPLVVSSSLRDALPFITLDDFTNQVQYADVAQSLNDRAIEAAVPDNGAKTLKGRNIRFLGAFTFQAGGSVEITPVAIDVGD